MHRLQSKQLTVRFFLPVFILLLGIISYSVYMLYQQSIQGNITTKNFSNTINDIVYYDEVLTMSSRMAVLTGNTTWIDRYNKNEKKLDKAINMSIEMTPEVNTIFKEIHNVNQALISMETQSFKLLKDGKKELAQKLLFSADYIANKKLYEEGIGAALQQLRKTQAEIAAQIKREFLVTLWIILFLLIVSLYFAKNIFDLLKEDNKKLLKDVFEVEQKTDALYKLSPIGIALTDMNGKYLEFNEAFEKITGYEKEELNQLDYWELTPKKYEADELKQLELLSETGVYGPYEKEYIQKSGKLIDIRLNGMLITDAENKQYIWSLVEDITDQKKYFKDLQQAQKLSKVGSWSLNYETGALDWSDEIFNIFALDKSTTPSYELFLEIIHPDDRQKVNDAYQKSVEEKTPYMVEHRIVVGDIIKYVREQGSTQYSVDGEPIKSTGTVQDITDVYESKKAIIEAKEHAESANRFKSEFLANMSHEIRTPMTGILGLVERLQKGESDPERLKQFNVIKASGNTLLNIINDILDFSKIERGMLNLESHPMKIHQILSETSSIFKDVVLNKKIDFIHSIDKSIPEYVLGDEVRLKQVIFNLLSNAFKFTSEGGNVTLEAKNIDGKYLYISVADTGVGIPREKIDQIFQEFQQADTSTTRKFGGTGLGLSISSKLIQMMHGELKVESTLGKGSTFSLKIPLVEYEAEALVEEEHSLDVSENMTLDGKILVVEDNKTNQMLMGFILDDLGVEFDVANDGVEGVKLYQDNQYDLILMDENMPNMNGIEATRQIRLIENEASGSKHIPIVAVTANALAEDKKRFLSEGMDDYISKPYTEEDIVKVVTKYLS